MRHIKSYQIFETAFQLTTRQIEHDLKKFVEIESLSPEQRVFVKSDKKSQYESPNVEEWVHPSWKQIEFARQNLDTIFVVDLKWDSLTIFDLGNMFPRGGSIDPDAKRSDRYRPDLKTVLEKFNSKFGLNIKKGFYHGPEYTHDRGIPAQWF